MIALDSHIHKERKMDEIRQWRREMEMNHFVGHFDRVFSSFSSLYQISHIQKLHIKF
jgi:hypothetical protein